MLEPAEAPPARIRDNTKQMEMKQKVFFIELSLSDNGFYPHPPLPLKGGKLGND
jgi:hypothetical protein